jgi:threonine dehydrogenase-like Zn-dependent dehydrogenase
MWTSTLELNLNRTLLMRLLGLVYPHVYSSSLSPLRVANVPQFALPSPSWVRVRNRLAGICGSDLHLVSADADIRTSVAAYPHYKHVYLGHEVVGEVIEIGEDVQHLRVGDRVVLQYGPNCLSSGAKPVCRACALGNYNLCEYGALPGPEPIGGGWSEEMLLHEQQLFRLPTELSDEQGVLLEPTAVALHAVLRHLPQASDNVLIIGAGTIGLLTLQILHALVPKARISMYARYPFQIEHATRLGADHIIYPVDTYGSVQRVTQAHLYKGILGNRVLTGGYDVIYDTVGQQKTLHHALRWLRAQGTLVLIGVNLHMMRIDLTPLWHQEINLLGSTSHGRETWPLEVLADGHGTPSYTPTFDVVTELIQQKSIQPEELITHRFALDKYQEALQAARHKKGSQSVKVLFDYALLPTSAVPNAHTSARAALFQPQSDDFIEELLKAQNGTNSHQDAEQEAVSQASMAQQTLPPKILDTPPPQVFARESSQNILNEQDLNQDYADEETDPAIPALRRPPYGSLVGSGALASSPQTPMPPATEPTPVLIVETPEKGAGQSGTNSLSAQPTLETPQADAASQFPPSTDDALLEGQDELLVNEAVPISAVPETTDMNVLTEEQLPTQTVLDHLFDTDASSMPAFLAELSNFVTPMIPEMPIEEAEGSTLPEGSETQPSVEEAEASPLAETSETAPPTEETEASLLPEIAQSVLETSETEQSVREAEAGPLPETPEIEHSVEETEASLLPETEQSVEGAEGTALAESSETEYSVEETEASPLSESSEVAQPAEEAEVPLAPNASANEGSVDSSDQIMGDSTVRIKSFANPKGKRKTSKSTATSATDGQDEKKSIEEKLLPKTQSEQVAAQEQVATNTNENTE